MEAWQDRGSVARTGLADPDPALTDCFFYHTMELPGEGVIPGIFDLRPYFDEYIGGVALRDKSVLDVGTATGFLAFEAEKRGARVTTFDIDSSPRLTLLPFAGSVYFEDWERWKTMADGGLRAAHNGFWYCHKRLKSQVRAIYGSFDDLLRLGETYDVVIAGALLEHVADPVTAIGKFAKLARDTLVLASTPIIMSDDVFMKPSNWDKNRPEFNYTWYAISLGMCRNVLTNLGFRVEALHFARFFSVKENLVGEKYTLVARREG